MHTKIPFVAFSSVLKVRESIGNGSWLIYSVDYCSFSTTSSFPRRSHDVSHLSPSSRSLGWRDISVHQFGSIMFRIFSSCFRHIILLLNIVAMSLFTSTVVSIMIYIKKLYCTISINSTGGVTCDRSDEIKFSTPGLKGCDQAPQADKKSHFYAKLSIFVTFFLLGFRQANLQPVTPVTFQSIQGACDL